MPWLLPVLVVGGVVLGGAWLAARAGLLGPGAAEMAVGKPDALAMLMFPPFSVTSPPRAGSVAYLAPAGISEAAARATIEEQMGPLSSLRVVRPQVPVPAPLGQGPTAYADLWAASSNAVAPPNGAASLTVSPESLARDVISASLANAVDASIDLQAAQLGLPAPTVPVDASRQLAAVLYVVSLRPAGDPLREGLFLPIAATQS